MRRPGFVRFIRARLLWRDDPAAGACLGLFLGALALALAAPALLLAHDPADVWREVVRPRPLMMDRWFYGIFALFLHGGLLILLFLRDAWARAFGHPARAAGWWCLLGVVIPVAGALAPCAWRLRRPRAALWAAAGTLCWLLCVMIMARDTGWNTLFALALAACGACWAAAVNGLPRERPATRRQRVLAWAAPVLLALVAALPELAQPAMDAWIHREAARARERGGLDITWDAMLAEYLGGLPPDTEPYATLFAPATRLPAFRDFEDQAAFGAYRAENAGVIALLDRVTSGEIEPVAHRGRPLNEWISGWEMPNAGQVFRWARWYAARMRAAAQGGDAADVLDALARLERIRALQRRSPCVYGANAAAVDFLRADALARAVPVLPDDALAELRRRLPRPAGDCAEAVKRTLFYQNLRDGDNALHFRRRYAGAFYEDHGTGRFLNYMSPLHVAWRKFRHALATREMGRLFALVETGGARAAAIHYGAPRGRWANLVMRDAMERFARVCAIHAALAEQERLALAAIADERRRRARDAAPETNLFSAPLENPPRVCYIPVEDAGAASRFSTPDFKRRSP